MRAQMHTTSFWGSLLLVFVVSAELSTASEAIESEKPRCALIAADTSPVVTLLEVKLLARDSETWLERGEIDRILAEQELQAVFGAKEGANRVALGKILKADVLVLLRSGVRDKQPFAELVVAETAGGLRLLARSVPLTEEPESDAEDLQDLIDVALAKHREAIREIYAIPPFVNQDLANDQDHLKAAYARVLEQALLARRGVLVVELDEADSLAREYEQAAADERPSRRLPLYLLGEYRHEGLGEERQVTISIQVKRGGEQVKRLKATMPPSEGATYLREATAQVLETAEMPVALPDVEVESRELATRGQVFLTLGNWSEAISLLEASLLLVPDQAEVRCEAVRGGVELALRAKYARDDAETLRLRRRAFEHCHRLFSCKEAVVFSTAMIWYSKASQDLDQVRANPSTSDETLAQVEELIRADTQFGKRVTERQKQDAEWQAACSPTVAARVDFPQERYAELFRHFVEHQDELSRKEKRSYFHGGVGTIERRAFLEQLLDNDAIDKEIQFFARSQLAEAEKLIDWEISAAIEASGESISDLQKDRRELTGQPIRLFNERDGVRSPIIRLGCKALENGVDLIWGRDDGGRNMPLSKLAKRGGEPTVLCPDITSPDRIEYDGEYAWLVSTGRIWVVDLIDGGCWRISDESGLPSKWPGARTVTPLGNGKAIAAGNTDKRGWIAEITFDRAGKHLVNVFHEAKEILSTDAQRNGQSTDQSDAYENGWKNPDVACSFNNSLALPLPGDAGASQQRVLVSRRIQLGNVWSFIYHPLIVNPNDLSVTVHENKYPGGAVHKGFCYFAESYFPDRASLTRKDRLMRAGLPDFKPEVAIPEISQGAPEIAQGRYILWQDTLTIIGKEWLQVDLATRQVSTLGKVPWEEHLGRKDGDLTLSSGFGYSNHLGYFVNCRERGGGEAAIQVLPDGSGMTFQEAIHTLHEPASQNHRASNSHAFKNSSPRKEDLWESNGRRNYTDLAYSPDGQLIITTCRQNPCVQAWDAATGLLIADLMEHSDAMRSVVFDRSGRYFATTGAEGSMFLWSAQELKLLHSIEGTHSGLASGDRLAFSWDGGLLASCLVRACEIPVWGTKDGRQRTTIKSNGSVPRRVEFTPDGRLIGFDGRSQTQLWNVESRRPAGRIGTVHQPLGFLPNGELLAVASNLDRSLIAWNLQSNTFRVLWQRSPRNVVAASPDGRYLLEWWGKLPRHMEPSSRRLTVWNIEEHKEVAATQMAVNAIHWRFSPDGKTIVAVGMNGLLWRWDLTRQSAREQMRIWTDISGKFSVEATFEELTAAGVRLKRKSGESVVVPLHRLSAESREFLGAIPTIELSASGPPGPGESVHTGNGWIEGCGQPVDPDGDCSFRPDRWMLTIDVPESHHDLSAEIGKMNAPRVLRKVDCDFTVDVEIEADFAPRNGVAEGRLPYQGAGIVAIQDEKNYIRVEHAAIRRPGQDELQHYVNVELRRNGVVPPGASQTAWISSEITHVGLERRGSEFIPFVQGRGTALNPLPMMRILFPAELTVGLVAINGSTEPFSPCFKHYRLLLTK